RRGRATRGALRLLEALLGQLGAGFHALGRLHRVGGGGRGGPLGGRAGGLDVATGRGGGGLGDGRHGRRGADPLDAQGGLDLGRQHRADVLVVAAVDLGDGGVRADQE